MKSIIENVIASRNYDLPDLLRKIDKLWLEGSISDAEREELTAAARENVNMDKGYADHESRIRALEEAVEALQKGDGEQPEADEYPAWKQPTGAHDAYFTGSKMTYTDGEKYECIAPEGVGVTYGPDVLPGFWQLVE